VEGEPPFLLLLWMAKLLEKEAEGTAPLLLSLWMTELLGEEDE
jgi:hypothetical protein